MSISEVRMSEGWSGYAYKCWVVVGYGMVWYGHGRNGEEVEEERKGKGVIHM